MNSIKFIISIILIGSFFNGFSQSIEFDSIRMLTNLQELSSDRYEGRATGTKGNTKARDYIVEQFDSIGLMPLDFSYIHDFAFWNRLKRQKIEGKNIIGWIEGTTFPNQFIVLSAHYDHVGIKKGKVYNGADDNASGTCALIEFADYFSKNPPLHSMLFAAFDAEELGLQGARCFVDEPPINKDSIILNLNMDMVSRNKKQELYICGTHHYPQLKVPLDSLRLHRSINILFGHDKPNSGWQDWTKSSDHGAFHAEGIPFLYFGVEDHKDYHKPEDDFERIQPSFYTQVVQFILDATKKLDAILTH